MVKKVYNAKDKIYRFILSTQEKNGYPPTIREICDGVGLSSPASVHRYVRILEDEGLLSGGAKKKRAYAVQMTERTNTDPVPLLGRVAAGVPIMAEENREDAFSIPTLLLHGVRNDAFMLRVQGESMKNAAICSGDIIVVETGMKPRDGDIVVARVDGDEVTVKRFFQKEKEIELRPENEAFSPIFRSSDRVEILGCVTGLMRSY
ncbi:MAG: transcriptional repressor LexA [Clostridia bacterium]|nr:transcriptional repressor LexA [Clostridia bacterium]